MAQRLEANEFIGHETESILALDDSAGKELVIVSVITAGDTIPKSFYRVKERGCEPVDYEEWYAAVDYYNCIAEKAEHTETKRNTFSIADMMNKK